MPVAISAIETNCDISGAAMLPYIHKRFPNNTDHDATSRALNIYDAGVADKFSASDCPLGGRDDSASRIPVKKSIRLALADSSTAVRAKAVWEIGNSVCGYTPVINAKMWT